MFVTNILRSSSKLLWKNNRFINSSSSSLVFNRNVHQQSTETDPENELPLPSIESIILGDTDVEFEPECPYKEHTPVMLNEVLSFMNAKPGQTILDLTCGSGGHTEALLESTENLTIYGLDRDPAAQTILSKLSEKWPNQFFPILGRFSEISDLLRKEEISKVDGLLIDCGCSSMQFNDDKRGFAISRDSYLDMRMDGDRFPNQPTVADILEHIEEDDLAKILKVYGEEKMAKKIARRIIEARYMLINIRTTFELAKLVDSALHSPVRLDKLGRPAHTATKTFQALRIFVNNEMNELSRAMEIASDILKPGGTLVTLSFHSLEDRIIKRHILGVDLDDPVVKKHRLHLVDSSLIHEKEDIDKVFSKLWTPINKHVIIPSRTEIEKNPRSRSAKLRCAVRN